MSNLHALLEKSGQSHLLKFWNDLSTDSQNSLTKQIESLDFNTVAKLYQQKVSGQSEEEAPADKAARAQPLADVIRQSDLKPGSDLYNQAKALGEEALKAGRVGTILVAGGQGTRLGFPHPKGLFPVGPISQSSLYQILCEQVLARSRHAEHQIPYYIMTSDATHDETLNFLEQNKYFGLKADQVFLFRQGTMPAVDAATGQILLSHPDTIALSPDGHGGILQALHNHGLIDHMKSRGIDILYYHQVDNPTSIVCDPLLIGSHILRESEMTTKVAAKRSWDEKMGILALIDDQTQIIEYSDLPNEVAQQTDAAGQLKYWAGNMAIHVFSRPFLERITTGNVQLPFHIAHKKVPHVHTDGHLVDPGSPNALKFERFIFDALLFAQKALVVEADRAREFNPVKNAAGQDSPATSREALLRIHREWLTSAGFVVPENTEIEISPLFALDATEVQAKKQQVPELKDQLYIR
jgi:UDP-N-acetylglucosamine/UDP-N-acetylgalactosamine diphosphorylase